MTDTKTRAMDAPLRNILGSVVQITVAGWGPNRLLLGRQR
jgi:hypothetical protein